MLILLNKELKEDLVNLIKSYKPNKVNKSNIKMKIIVKDDIPIAQRPRRLPFKEQEIVEAQIKDWLDAAIIKPSSSEYSSPIVLCKKKDVYVSILEKLIERL